MFKFNSILGIAKPNKDTLFICLFFLGGDSKTLMFIQISPNESDLSETLCSLNFASRVRGIELGPAKKQLDTTELLKYKQTVQVTLDATSTFYLKSLYLVIIMLKVTCNCVHVFHFQQAIFFCLLG